MALLFMDSFDHYATADILEKWTTSGVAGGASLSIHATGGRHSSASLRYSATSTASAVVGYLSKTLAVTGPTAILGFAVVTSAAPGSSGFGLAAVGDGATTQVTLRLNANMTLSILRGPTWSATLLGTSAAALAVNVPAYIEWKTLIDNTAGTSEVRVNGATVLTLTGLDTQHTAVTQWTGIGFSHEGLIANAMSGSLTHVDFDDLYVLDGSGAAPWNTFLGDCRVDARYPTAAGATTGWTPSAGANWQNVDDAAPNDDTDYNAAAAAGLTDTFVIQDAPVAGAAIYGVQHCLSAKKTDTGAATIAPVIRHSGVDYVGAGINPSTAYAVQHQIAATNPGTAVAWTEAGFNGAEFGYTRTV